MQTKKELRSYLKKVRAGISKEYARDASTTIYEHISSLDAYHKSTNIAAYYSVGSELDTKYLIEQIYTDQKKCFLPVISDDKLVFAQYDGHNLVNNKFDIPEPNEATPIISTSLLDIIIMPTLGFDKKLNRLGMGKGYYDRTIGNEGNKTVLIGLAYACQELDSIPVDPWDKRLDYIVTEKGTLG